MIKIFTKEELDFIDSINLESFVEGSLQKHGFRLLKSVALRVRARETPSSVSDTWDKVNELHATLYGPGELASNPPEPKDSLPPPRVEYGFPVDHKRQDGMLLESGPRKIFLTITENDILTITVKK